MSNASTQPRDPDPAPALRVLIVEDNATDAMVAEAAVAKAASGPFTVLHAGSAARGLDLIASEDVHLVLLDLNLPDSRGMDTLRRARAATRSPIIIVTSEDTPGMDEVALAEGAFEILHKGRLGVDAIARLLRLAERQHRMQARLEMAEQGAARRAGARRDTSTLNQPQFRSATKAREYLETIRWPFGPVCPRCGTTGDHRWIDAIGGEDGYWKCHACDEPFSVTAGTIFEHSAIPLHVWLQAVYLLCCTDARTSSRQLPRALGVTNKTAWLMAKRIREAVKPDERAPAGKK